MMMDREDKTANFHRLLSEESCSSDVSSDSCEYYQTEIFGLLPSSQAHRRPHADAVTQHPGEGLGTARVSWNPSVPLRARPVCLQGKRDIRERQHVQRRSIGYWDSWRRSQQTTRRRLKEHVGGALSGLLPWRHAIHKIEGQFGVGVKAYFVFLRYLLWLNLLYCVIIAGSVLTPTLVFRQDSGHPKKIFGYKDIFVGSGVLENSPVFHSFYTRGSLDLACLNTPLLFLLGMISVLFLSIIMVVRRTVVGYKHSWLTGNRLSSNLSYKVFCGWDFSIQDSQAATLKQNFIRNELKMDLEEQKFHERVQRRSLRLWVRLILLRVFLNIIVLVLLGSAFALIFYSIVLSVVFPNDCLSCHYKVLNWSLMLEYLPPITMATINYILPHIFSKVSEFEDYSLTIQLNLTLIRSIFLKLASLGIYLFFLLIRSPTEHQICREPCGENAFGKEMYKLTVFNFLECFFNAFFVAYPRTFLVERFPSSSLARLLGKKQFEIPFNVLDLVNSQTVTWVGVFYCPLLPAISAVRLMVLFYLKKFTVERCCVPAQRMFRTASSSVLFHFMLLLGLLMSVVTLVVNINRFHRGCCGPFKDRTVFNVTSVCIKTLPNEVQNTISYISSEAFAFALILAEVVILTSYVSRRRANRKAIERLKDMLVMCSSDKRFLVKQHSTISRRQLRTR
ncbi:transmembrane channel-like protein 7 [Rhinichthys klamathensis goyatoka]|uniref:transmembrane channel-like protein 7 n=1 Tax=Rhinichthys klamathensis goyatoka TaxID=3034132 RepID=UPI0024B5096A|nr:transmembrane channel-like protein 7 [Rhinichthys klamathensis goyatoka]